MDWNDSLAAKQKELEDLAVEKGSTTFLRRLEEAKQKGRTATHGAGLKLLREGIQPLEEALTFLVEEKKRGRPHMAVRWVREVGASVAAYLTVKVVLDHIYAKRSLRKVALEVANALLDEVRFRRFQNEAPALWDWKIKRFQGTANYAHKRRSLMASMSYAEIDCSDLDVPLTERYQIGVKLVDCLQEVTGLIRADKRPGKPGTPHYVVSATEETLEWLGKRNDSMQGMFPTYYPMVVPPLPWAPGERGGYRFALRAREKFVRDWEWKDEQREMPVVYNAVNAVQATAWRINHQVLEIAQEIERRRGGIAGTPSLDPLEKPLKPHDIDTNDDARRAWRKASGVVENLEHRRQGKAGEFVATLHMAEQVRDFEAIWFPHNVDFRGRTYPLTTFLQPQGNDLCRALLEFADGKALGPSGAGWLAVHLANCLDELGGLKMSKLSIQERADWVVQHSDRIRQVAEDPWADLWWTEADKPLQFYAACCEWLGYLEEGEAFVSRLPIAQDGTCNGLQHFAALFRDAQGGAAVNMLDTERPEDLYQRVADAVLSQLEAEAHDDDFARLWLSSGLVDRKLVKRPSMTFVYGSKRYGFKSQIVDELQSRDNWREIREHFTIEGKAKVRPAAGYLAKLIWHALGDVTVSAFEGMSWMQACARAAARVGNMTTWDVPLTGFHVIQRYSQLRAQRVQTMLAGSLIKSYVYHQGDTPLSHRQANAVAPNFIHSLDAAALMLTVNECVRRGVESFSMIHDSFATHAADSDTLADVLREQFVRLHEQPIVDLLRERFEQLAEGEELPEPPAIGSLDLSQVLESTYFFS